MSAAEYVMVRKIGEGKYGQVFLTRKTTSPRKNQKFAVKVMKSQNREPKIQEEYDIHKSMNHKNIIKVYDLQESTASFNLIMEFAENKDIFELLSKYRGGLGIEIAHFFFKQLISGMKYIHSQGVVHRDIKVENLLITKNGTVKICDFGKARSFKNGEQDVLIRGRGGTQSYSAPEIFTSTEYRGPPVDIWSSGIVLVRMLLNRIEWETAEETNKKYQDWKNGKILEKAPWKQLDGSVLDLIKHILTEDVDQRWSIEQVERSEWVQTEYDVDR